MRRIGLTLTFVTWAGVASAQTATPLDRFEPAPAGDDFTFVPSPDVRGGLRPAANVALSFARSPLVLADPRLAEPEIDDVVSHQLALHGLVSIELLHRVKLELDIPVTLTQDGSSPAGGGLSTQSPSGAAMNDIRLGARVLLLEQRGYWPAAAATLTTWFPSGDEGAYTSSGRVRVAPTVVIGADYDSFVWSTTVGRRFDSAAAGDGANDNLLGHELLFGVAAGPRIGPFLLSAELWGSTVSQRGTDAFSAATTNLEAHLAAKYERGPFAFRLAAGPGLTTGVGTPDYRIVASIGYAPSVLNAWERGRQQDRLDDAFATAPGPASAKPAPPSPASAADGDGDGVIDAEDRCPALAGSPASPDRGCPADRDGDAIFDRDDACPDTSGVSHPDPSRHGCAADRDGDGVIDTEDACPTEHGKASAEPQKNGCPDAVRVVGAQIVILERVEFETGSAELRPQSADVLDQVAKVLGGLPEIVRVAIEGHTDDVGDERANIELSQQRALTVMRWLIDHGVDERRLEARGFGPRQPVTTNESPEGRAKNRRVDFRIVKRSKAGEAAWTDGAVEPEQTKEPTPPE